MRAHLTRRYWFPASHRLHSERLSAAENRRTYGKCNNPHGHGHNYTLEVTVAGPVAEKTGMVCDIVELDGFVEREILEPFGYANLNRLEPFRDQVPTTENLCIEVYDRLARGFGAARVEKVRLEETLLNAFEYAGQNGFKRRESR